MLGVSILIGSTVPGVWSRNIYVYNYQQIEPLDPQAAIGRRLTPVEKSIKIK
jgi:hypothetical protein